jgi:hypothetical protein
MNVLRIVVITSLLSIAGCATSTEPESADTSSAASTRAASITAKNRSCASVRDFVDAHGAALVYSSATIYERVVTSGAYCEMGETTSPYWVATSDSDSCLAGYVCTLLGGGGGE